MENEKDLNIDVFDSSSINPLDVEDDQQIISDINIIEENEFPHITINSRDFVNALNTCGTVLEPMNVDNIYKSIMIEADGASCNFRAIGPVSKLHFHCGLQNANSDLILKDKLFISYDLLMKVCKVLGSNVQIIKKDDGLYIRLIGGDLKITTETFDEHRFDLPQGDLQELLSVDANKFGSTLGSFEGLVNNAIKSSDKRIFLHNNAIYFNDLSTWTKAEFKGITSDLVLRSIDIKVLRKLIETSESTKITFNKVNSNDKFNYVLVNTTNSTFSFIADSNPFNTNILDEAELKESVESGVDVDAATLKKYSVLSTVLPNASEYLNLLVSDNNLICVIEQKTAGLSKFNLPITSINKELNMKNPVRVNSRKFDSLLAALNCPGSVRVYTSEDNNLVYLCKVPEDNKVNEVVYSLIIKV